MKVILPILCLGMLLDGAMGLARADSAAFSLDFLGHEDGVRLRMLRLARAAVTALSVTAFLYQELVERAGAARPLARAGQVALWVGVAAMPTVLVAAAFLSLGIKYLLPIPALANFAGACVGVGLAVRQARPLETWGWSLMAASMRAGRDVRYFTETDVSVADDEELLDLLYPSGCRQLLIALERRQRGNW